MTNPYNLEHIQAAVKDASAGWYAGPTTLTILPEEDQRKRLGYYPGPGEPSLQQREMAATANADAFRAGVMARAVGIPAAIDWRNNNGQNFVTPIKDQGGCGSCVAFGTVTTVESAVRISRNDPNLNIDLSEAHLFYCHGQSQGRNCDNGWWVDPALNSFMNPGVADESCYPYTAGDQACTGLCGDWQNRVTKLSGWHAITSVPDMKGWLAEHGPMVTCFTVYNDFFAYRTGVYHHVTGGLAGGHCVSTVGYDDNAGAWICKNSWGTGWGESGFFRIGYGEVGIDGTMWAVDAVLEDAWYNNVKIQGLWTINEDRNAWVFVSGLGWKKIAYDNDNIFIDMLLQLTAAKAAGSLVNIHVHQNLIDQIYVW